LPGTFFSPFWSDPLFLYFRVKQGPSSIRRENRVTSMGISIDLEDLTVNEAKKKIRRVMDTLSLAAGYSWNYGRSFSFEDETAKTMMINTLLALALIYFVMASLFESLMLPAAVWVSIIFAIIGVWWFFLFTGTIFSFMAWIGVLVLIGVVVNNGFALLLTFRLKKNRINCVFACYWKRFVSR
jgi:HAE1 family hydrophobic/amphiphilic exporter-1